MKVFKIIIIGILMQSLCSCGALSIFQDWVHDNYSQRQFETTNPIFNPYIAVFEEYGRKYRDNDFFSVGDIPINFGEIESDKFEGICTTYGNGKKEIIIRESWWNSNSEASRRSLIFHELGHCRLGRAHHDEKIDGADGIEHKISLMNSRIVPGVVFKSYEQAYLKELFTEDSSDLQSALASQGALRPLASYNH